MDAYFETFQNILILFFKKKIDKIYNISKRQRVLNIFSEQNFVGNSNFM
jgi:hypothetical protein